MSCRDRRGRECEAVAGKKKKKKEVGTCCALNFPCVNKARSAELAQAGQQWQPEQGALILAGAHTCFDS